MSDAAARGLSEDELFAKLEDDYWRIVEHATGEESEAVIVDYGNDLDTPSYWSGFPTREGAAPPPPPPSDAAGAPPPPPTATAQPELPSPEQLRRCEWGSTEHVRQSGWNLNNLPAWPGSVLRHFRVPVPGINVPWLYVGMLFSTFCWHNEDNYLASINAHHVGAPKQWYGVPGVSSGKFEDVVRKFLSQTIKKIPDLLHHMNTQFSPSLLRANGVPVYQVRQNPGEFVVTFPQAFHGGFSYGFNVGEAVNFANTQWIKHAYVANERYRRVGRLAVLSHDRLMFTLLHHLGDLDRDSARRLFEELIRLVHEELVLRPRLYTLGVRDVSTLINLPPNRTDIIDNESSDYDDKRVCCVCQHTCFLSTPIRVQLLAVAGRVPAPPSVHVPVPAVEQVPVGVDARRPARDAAQEVPERGPALQQRRVAARGRHRRAPPAWSDRAGRDGVSGCARPKSRPLPHRRHSLPAIAAPTRARGDFEAFPCSTLCPEPTFRPVCCSFRFLPGDARAL